MMLGEQVRMLVSGMSNEKKPISPDISGMDYKYGIFYKIGTEYTGKTSRYWKNHQIKHWMDLNEVQYEKTDKRVDLIERIKQAGYK